MRRVGSIIATSLILCVSLPAQEKSNGKAEVTKGDSWTKELKDRSKRDALQDALQKVRGDSGRWNDDPMLQHAPP